MIPPASSTATTFVAELRRRVQRHLVAVLREVERRRDASVARSEHRDAHPDLLALNRGRTPWRRDRVHYCSVLAWDVSGLIKAADGVP